MSPFYATCPSCHKKNTYLIRKNIRNAEILRCAHCGNEFYRKRSVSKYCSPLCQRRAAAKAGGRACHEKHDFSGKNNPNWRNGISKNHYHYKKLQLERYPEKIRCRSIFIKEKAKGNLRVPSKCQVCGAKAKLHGHHEDYSKPLEVTWVCRPCHRKIHGGKH